ncbi:hypothetical protein [Sutcliffiella deserti]|uniref:hypothetical protein n=1 Tax=Sutcliffiella deserti TaxID=2875501 RepID=UPI001CBABB87|nr:hypothetical protein [Sutcliffiella deserti]
MLKRKKIFVTVLLAISLIFAVHYINLTLSNKGYEEYHSNRLMNDFSTLTHSLLDNQKVYKEIISTEVLSQEQVERIYNNTYAIINFYEDYSELAVQLNRFKRDGFSTSDASFNIEAVFNRKIAEISETDQASVTLDEDFLMKVETISNLNQAWIEVLNQHMIGFEIIGSEYRTTEDRVRLSRDSITEDFWVTTLEMFNYKAQENERELKWLLN